MNETNLTRKLIRKLNEHPDTWVYKTMGSMTRAGVPDLLICHQGLFVGAEVKVPGNYATKLQLHEIDRINDCGGMAAVVRSFDDIKDLMDEVRTIA